MYTSVLNRNRNKKKESKHTSLRSTSTTASTRPAILPFPTSSTNSLVEPTHSSRSISKSPIPLAPHSRPQSSLPSSVIHNSPSHIIPRPINSSLQNTDSYSWHPHSRTDHQCSPLNQSGYYQQNQQQQQDSWASAVPRLTSAAISLLPNFSEPINHRSKQYDSPYANVRLQAVAAKYNICNALAQRLSMLEQFDIVLLCDDSSSMNTPVEGIYSTRWGELQAIVNIIVEISVILDSNGIDVHFLNRDAVFNVTHPQQIQKSFAAFPFGGTPLTPALRRIFKLAANKMNEKKHLLVFVATDGEPTDSRGNVDIPSLEKVMLVERQADRMHVAFLTCTDDKSSVAYLSKWDRTMINVDVIDDYKTEREEVRQVRGYRFPFSFGDYIAKALLGAVDPQMDSLDEPPNNSYHHRSSRN